jgi:PAS domain S-box-containing protein
MKLDARADGAVFPLMAMNILRNVLSRADNLGDQGAYLSEEIRKFAGAQCVLLIQCPSPTLGESSRVVSVSPSKKRAWAESDAMSKLYDVVHDVAVAQCWRGSEPSELSSLLRRQGFELSLILPLSAGSFRVGSVLILGLPDEKQVSSLLNLLNPVSTVVALALRDTFLLAMQEQIIAERTKALQYSNKQLQIELSERKKAESLLNGQTQVMELVAEGAPLAESLTALVDLMEKQIPGMIGSILLLDEDGVHLRHGAAPSLPLEYSTAIDGVAIGPTVGSCGTAAYRKKPVYVEDIASDPLWAVFKGAALPHGLRACWSTPIFDPQRQVLGTFAMYYRQPALPQPSHLRVIDVTTHIAAIAISRHRTEGALRQNSERLRLAVQASNVGLWDWCIGTSQVVYSPEWKRQLGYEEHEIGSDLFEWESRVHPDDLGPAQEKLRACCEDGRLDYVAEFRMRHKDGSYRWIYARAEVLRDVFGGATHMLGCHVDITGLKLAEEEQRRLNRELRAISKCGLTMMRAEDEQSLLKDVCSVVCNEAGYRMAWVGYAETDEAKTGKIKIVRPAAWAGVEEGFFSAADINWADPASKRCPSGMAIQSGKSVCAQDFCVNKDAAPWCANALARGYRSCIALPLKDESGGTFGVLTIYSMELNAFTPNEIRLLEELAGDLSFGIMVLRARIKRDQAEDTVRKLNQELEQRVVERTTALERANQELEAFSYSVSHDLRAPLRAIEGFSRILLEDHLATLDEEGRRYLGLVCQGADRMGQLIDDILAFSRMSRSALGMVDVNMTVLAQEIFDELVAAVPERRIRLVMGDLPPAYGDPAMIRRVLGNLIGNAVKYTGPRKEAIIEVSGTANETETVYCVHDNGVGFDIKYVGKLFGVFQRLCSAEEFEGTGIGLAIVKRIVERHGGRVWAEGKPEEGASLYFTLPRCA